MSVHGGSEQGPVTRHVAVRHALMLGGKIEGEILKYFCAKFFPIRKNNFTRNMKIPVTKKNRIGHEILFFLKINREIKMGEGHEKRLEYHSLIERTELVNKYQLQSFLIGILSMPK